MGRSVSEYRIGQHLLYAVLLFCCLQIYAGWLVAEPLVACGQDYVEEERATMLASASTWANLRKSQGSLAAESKRLLDMIGVTGNEEENSGLKCPDGCLDGKVDYLFSSVPHKFLKNYSDEDYCSQMLEKTTKAPFEFNDRSFVSLDELNDWFSEFSQGNGDDGEELYEKCNSSCSPQYYNAVSKDQTGTYHVNSRVICGPARDKSDNQYDLRLVLRRKCL
ncbi:MAG: hypothetical protein PHC51_07365 [bacterium]|nr:hypothetical protein [bacterium]